LFEPSVTRASAIETLDPDTLIAWADAAPDRRYPRLGVPVFKVENLDQVTGLSPAFVFVLKHAPDKAGFLGDPYSRVHPMNWSGSLVTALDHRKAMLGGLAELGDAEIDRWLDGAMKAIDTWIASERKRESQQEESFE
jgi:hypothetical protein